MGERPLLPTLSFCDDVFWDFEVLRVWDVEILRFWDFEVLRF